MNKHQLHEYYWLNGVAIKSFHLDIQHNTAEIGLLVGQIDERDLVLTKAKWMTWKEV